MTGPIPFVRDMAFQYGVVDRLSPLIRRVIAKNPGPFTFHGTGTYIIGNGRVAVIDPGPADIDHLAALTTALEGETVSHILITHTHRDHSPLATALKEQTGALTYAFGPHGAGRLDPRTTRALGADWEFQPDHAVEDGDVIAGDGWTLEAVHTPGHAANHLCFALHDEKVLFSGDHVMGWSTSIISPPDGHMGDYLAALEKLLGRDDALYWPTHGPAITDPHTHVRALIAHRQQRERTIMDALAQKPRPIPDLVAELYAEVPAHLHPAAARSVLAHLDHMEQTGRVRRDGMAGDEALYRALVAHS